MNLKTILASIVALFTAIIGIFVYGRKAGKDSEKAKSTAKARETEHKATEALTKGLKHEQDIVAAARARRAERMRDRKQS